MFKKALPLLLLQFMLILVVLLLVYLRSFGGSVWVFWPTIMLVIIITVIGVFNTAKPHPLIFIISLEICLSLIYVLAAPYTYQLDRDIYFESEYASTIVREGMWDPTLGVGFAENYYGYNPLLHFMLAISSVITGLTTFALSKYIYFVVLRVLLMLSVFLLISEIVKKEQVQYLAMLVFTASSGMAFVQISRRLTASIFLVLSLYALIKAKTDNKKWVILFYIFSIFVVIGNHSLSFLLLLILGSVWLFSLLMKIRLFKQYFPNREGLSWYPATLIPFIYFVVIFYLWEALVAVVLLHNDMGYLRILGELIYGGYGVQLLFQPKGELPAIFIYRSYETIIIYLYHAVFFITANVGFLIFAFRSRLAHHELIKTKNLLLFFGIFSSIMYIVAFTLLRTSLDSAAYTFLWFFCFPLSIFFAYLVHRICAGRCKKSLLIGIVAFLLLFLFTGYLFSGIYTPRLTNRDSYKDIVLGIDIRARTPAYYSAAAWLYSHAPNNSTVIGDITAFEIFSGYFEFEVSTDEYKTKLIYNGSLNDLNFAILDNQTFFGSYRHTFYYSPVDYIVINKRYYTTANYLFGYPVAQEKAERFMQTAIIDKVYDNGDIELYKRSENP